MTLEEIRRLSSPLMTGEIVFLEAGGGEMPELSTLFCVTLRASCVRFRLHLPPSLLRLPLASPRLASPPPPLTLATAGPLSPGCLHKRLLTSTLETVEFDLWESRHDMLPLSLSISLFFLSEPKIEGATLLSSVGGYLSKYYKIEHRIEFKSFASLYLLVMYIFP